MVRRVVACIAALSVLVVAGCSSAPRHPKPTKTPRATAVTAMPAEVAALPRQDVTVATSDPLKGKVASYYAGGQVAHPGPGGNVIFSLPRNAAGVVIGYDKQNRVLGTAVTVQVDGAAPVPVTVDATSTAFTRLLTTPPFVTSDPAEVIVLRVAAEQSPHLAGLAREIDTNARNNPRYMTEPTTAEAGEFAALVEDVFNTLNAWSVAVGGPQVTPASLAADQNGVTVPAVYRPGAAVTTPAEYTSAQTLARPQEKTGECNTGITAYGTPGGTGVCVTSVEKQAGGYRVEAKNNGPSTALIFSADSPLVPLTILPARVFKLPTITEVVKAVAKNLAAAPVRVIVDGGCKVARWFGSDICGKPKKEDDKNGIFTKAIKGFADIVKDVDKPPTSTFLVPTTAEDKPLYVVTTGGRNGDVTALPGHDKSQLDVQISRAATSLLTLYSQVLKPLYELVTGFKAPEENPPASTDGKSEGLDMKPVKDILENDEEFRLDLLDAFLSKDLQTAMKAIVKVTIKVVTNGELLLDVLKLYGASITRKYALQQIANLVVTIGTDAIPGPGWLKAVIDVGDKLAKAINFGFGVYTMHNGVRDVDDFGGFHPVLWDPATPLKQVNWDNYDGYVWLTGSYQRLKLTGGAFNESTPWGPEQTSKLGVTYGTMTGQPCALVALLNTSESGGTIMLYLFGLDGETPKLQAVVSVNTALKFRAALDNDKVVLYTSDGGSSGWQRGSYVIGGPAPEYFPGNTPPAGVKELVNEAAGSRPAGPRIPGDGGPRTPVDTESVPAGPIGWN